MSFRSKAWMLSFFAAAIVAGALFYVLLPVYHEKKGSDVWQVILLTLPPRISPSEMSMTGYYIVKQTHEPVLRKDDGYNYSSKILNEWSRSIDYRTYKFCPNTSLSFSEGRLFSLEFFRAHLEKTTQLFDGVARISQEGNCVSVAFARPAKRYLDFLTAYSSAPSIRISSAIEAGLGPYSVAAMSENAVILRRKQKVKNGFNEIRFTSPDWKPDTGERTAAVLDYNFRTIQGKEKLCPGYLSFDNMVLESTVLLINLPDLELRQRVYDCVDIDALRQAFSDDVGVYNYIQTILPVGVPGAHPGRPTQECRGYKAAAKKYSPINFVNWRSARSPQLEAFAKALYEKTGLRVNIVNYPPAELNKMFHSNSKPYGLVVIFTSPDSDENYRMLASYFGKNNLLDFDVPGVEKMYGELRKAEDAELQRKLAEGIAKRIDESRALLPLFQRGRRVYYPKTIKNLIVGRELLEYPEIADYRW